MFAGNLEDRQGLKILSFGLAPHAGSEYLPIDLADYYRWRVAYFDAERTPHRIHRCFAHLAWGMRGISVPPSEAQSRWLHHNDDLIRFYARDWTTPR